MAGHSKYKNIIHRKKSQGKKKSKLFTRVVKDIIIAAKVDIPDPNFNSKLRNAVIVAKQSNVSKDKIDKALNSIKLKTNDLNCQKVMYEGYGPGRIAIIIETYTNNKNRTTADIRAVLHKYGGCLLSKGSVRHMFKKIVLMTYKTTNIDKNRFINTAIDLEIDDYTENNTTIDIILSFQKHCKISKTLEQNFGTPAITVVKWLAGQFTKIDQATSQQFSKFLDKLNNLNNTLVISSNYKIMNI